MIVSYFYCNLRSFAALKVYYGILHIKGYWNVLAEPFWISVLTTTRVQKVQEMLRDPDKDTDE